MSWTSLIPAAAGLASAYIGANAAGKATDAQTAAANNANEAQTALGNRALDIQKDQYDQGRADLAPYREAGQAALGTYAGEVNQPFTQTPGYQFAFDEGRRAVDASASARGMLDSGARLRELTRYGTGMAEQGYGQYANRLASLAGIGQTATNTGVAQGQGYASGTANTLGQMGQMQGANATQIGNAQAAGAVGTANAINGGINNATLLYALGQGR